MNLSEYKVDTITVGSAQVGDFLVIDKHDYAKDDDGGCSRIDFQEALKVVATGAIMGSGPRPTIYMVGFEDGVVRYWEDRRQMVRLTKRSEAE